MSPARAVAVLIASPGDVEAERAAFREAVGGIQRQDGIRFEPKGFEDQFADAGLRAQDKINLLVDHCDVFVTVFHRRWGRPTDAPGCTSYTEEEFERARRRFGSSGSPRIMCFFKDVELAALADPGEQLAKVLEFRRRLEASGRVLYRPFSSTQEFASDLSRHLNAHADGKLPAIPPKPRRLHIPILADHMLDSDRGGEGALLLQAQHAAEDGQIETATLLFARISQTSRNIEVLDATQQFFSEIGHSDGVQALFERKMTLLQDRRFAAREYAATILNPAWREELVVSVAKNAVAPKRAYIEAAIRKLFTETKFETLMVESLARHLTLGELLALSRFYRGDGATVASKFGYVLGAMMKEVLAPIAAEHPELFRDTEGTREVTIESGSP